MTVHMFVDVIYLERKNLVSCTILKAMKLSPSTLCIFMLSGFFFATSVGDILNFHVTPYTCTLSWRLPEVYQREPPDRMILTAKKAGAAEDSEPYWEEIVTDLRREACCFEVKPKDVFSVTLIIIHNKGTASTEVKEFEVPGTCTCTIEVVP